MPVCDVYVYNYTYNMSIYNTDIAIQDLGTKRRIDMKIYYAYRAYLLCTVVCQIGNYEWNGNVCKY